MPLTYVVLGNYSIYNIIVNIIMNYFIKCIQDLDTNEETEFGIIKSNYVLLN